MQFRVYQEYYQILQGTGAKVLFDIKFSIYGCWTDSRRGAVSAIQDTTRIFRPPQLEDHDHTLHAEFNSACNV